jgi:hypothetical protein
MPAKISGSDFLFMFARIGPETLLISLALLFSLV